MALSKKDIIALGKQLGKADRSAPVAYSYNGTNFSYDQLNDTFSKELRSLGGTMSDYRDNKNLIFSIIEEVMADVLPKKAQDAYSSFAEVKYFKQGDKPLFRRKVDARTRAKQFITRVGLAGIYEVFKLGGSESFEVQTSAIGGAAQIGLEEMMDGKADFAELTSIVMDGINETIYQEAAKALQTAVNQLPGANKVATAGFDEAAFDSLINVAAAYGEPVIYCTYEFAVKMIPTQSWRYTESMKQELWNNGMLQTYKGRKVVILPQYFKDESNTTKTIDPGYVWIIPSGGDNKPVKIAFEGQPVVDEFKNHDRSREIQVYVKVGVTALMTNNICSYIDTSLQGKMNTWSFTTPNVTNEVTVITRP